MGDTFRKYSKEFLKKNAWFWHLKFWKNFRTISKSFLRKLRKMYCFTYYSQNLTNHPLLFCAFGGKTQFIGKFWEIFENVWWKFYWKLIYVYFRKFVTKNGAFGNNTIFLQHFFRFGGGISPFPLATPLNLTV